MWKRVLGVAGAITPLAYAAGAYAATGGGGTMPWDAPLLALQNDLTGPTATALSLIGIVAVFGVLIFGGEMNHFFRTLCYIILLVSVLVAGQNFLTQLGITGATVEGGEGVFWLFSIGLTAVVTSGIWSLGLYLRSKRKQLLGEMDQKNETAVNQVSSR